MKKLLMLAPLLLITVSSLAGCAHAEVAATASAKPTTADIYTASDGDHNGITHWVFTQRLPDGSTVQCVAAGSVYTSDALAISCLRPQAR